MHWPRVEPEKQGVVPDWTRGPSPRIGFVDRPSWIGHAWSIKNREVFQIGQIFFVYFFDTVLITAHVERVSVSRMREFLYLLCLVLRAITCITTKIVGSL